MGQVGQLSDRDAAVLAVEAGQWASTGDKERYLLATLGLTPARYYQVLNALLDDPAALATDPVLVGRLRRLRDERSRARSSNSPAESV